MDKEWNWYQVSGNPNITYNFIASRKSTDWDWLRIGRNKFSQHSHLIKKEREKREKKR